MTGQYYSTVQETEETLDSAVAIFFTCFYVLYSTIGLCPCLYGTLRKVGFIAKCSHERL